MDDRNLTAGPEPGSPRAESPGEPAQGAALPPDAGFSAARVIVVEDNPSNLMALMKLLRMAGIERVNWRTTGRHVVEFIDALYRANNGVVGPDLILLDIALPGEDGYAVLAQLRAHPTLRATRVVAVTAYRTEDEVLRARRAGFDGFIGKPLDPTRFPDQVRRMLAGEAVWEPE